MNNNRFLIVNADDFGLTKGINRGIIHCFQNGIVRSASLLATGPAFTDAVTLAKKNHGLSIGLHLTLVNEKPVLLPSAIRSLIGATGKFHYSYKQFILKYFLGQINLEEVKQELEAQIKKTLQHGINITHFDSHQQVHLLPGIFAKVVILAKQFNIKNIRVLPLKSLSFFRPEQVALKIMIWKLNRYIRKSDAHSIQNFWGINQSGKISETELLNFINRCPRGVTEIMCHPGFIDEDYLRYYKDYYDALGFDYRPESEVQAFTSKKVREFLKLKNITLINFANLNVINTNKNGGVVDDTRN